MTASLPQSNQQSDQTTRRNWVYLFLAIVVTLPWIFVYYTGARDAHGHFTASHLFIASLSGLAILAAAFLLSWGAEVAQLDMSQALALVILSLIAILPEYAVDMSFAWDAGKGLLASQNPATANLQETHRLLEKGDFTIANMTGANRLLIGIAWTAVVFIHCWRTRKTIVVIESSRIIEIKFLLIATLYSFTLPLKAVIWDIGLHWMDAVVLVTLFGLYTFAASKAEHVEPELVGPPAAIAPLPTKLRRAVCYGLFVGAAWTIFLAAHPFSDSLVQVGKHYNINEFLLVQWIAPLASEMPEFIVAGLFAWRGFPAMGMGALISSKVNQWTLLVGLLPICYGIAAQQAAPLHLDQQQTAEVMLTSAQSLFAVAVLLNFNISLGEAAGLLVLFLAQAIAQFCINFTLLNTPAALALTQYSQYFFSAVYVILAIYTILMSSERRAVIKSIVRGTDVQEIAGSGLATHDPDHDNATKMTIH